MPHRGSKILGLALTMLLASRDTQVAATAGAPALSVVSWNVHWQCGGLDPCREAAATRLQALSKEVSADVVVAIELEQNVTAPLDLPGTILPGWQQVSGSCPGQFDS